MSFQIGPYQLKKSIYSGADGGVSEMTFRVIAMEMGAALAPTELISAKGIFFKNRRTLQYLTYDREREVPIPYSFLEATLRSWPTRRTRRGNLRRPHRRHQHGLPGKKSNENRLRLCIDDGPQARRRHDTCHARSHRE